MAADHVRCVLEARALNGESPVWDDRRQRLFWVDIREPALHAFDPLTGDDQRWEMPAWVGCVGLGEYEVALALRTGLYAMHIGSGAMRSLACAPFDPRGFIFNDGGCDPAGRFLAGPMYVPLAPEPKGDADKAPLWRYDGDGRWTALTLRDQVLRQAPRLGKPFRSGDLINVLTRMVTGAGERETP
jgi:sugar lactone lactonase YvrE